MGLYVAVDGSYGDSEGIALIDDHDWIESDYAILEEQGNHRRADTAEAIDRWVKEGRPEFENFNPEKDYIAEFLLQKYIGY